MLRRLPDNEALAPAGPVRVYRPADPALHGVIARLWVTRAPEAVLRVLPDAATDLVFAGGRANVAGPDTTACLEHLPADEVVLGCQLRPAAVPAVLGVPAAACRDQRVDLRDLWGQAGRDVVESMTEATDVGTAARLLEAAVARRMRHGTVAPAAAGLRGYAGGDERTIASWGLSDRQTRRLSTATYGYGPRTLRRVLRFRTAVAVLRDRPGLPLAGVAVLTGYADQPHLTHDVTALSGLTPQGLRAALATSEPW